MFTQIMQAFTMIRFRGTYITNIRSDLANQFFVETQYLDLAGFPICFERDTGRRFDLDWM